MCVHVHARARVSMRACVCFFIYIYCGICYFLCASSILMIVRDLHSHDVCTVHPQPIFVCKGKFKRGHWGCSKVTGNLT